MTKLFDNILTKLFPHRLIVGHLYQNATRLSVSILHPDSTHNWNRMDTLELKPGSLLEYRGTVKKNHLTGNLDPQFLLFEIRKTEGPSPVEVPEVVQAVKGDIVSLDPESRENLAPAAPDRSFNLTSEIPIG